MHAPVLADPARPLVRQPPGELAQGENRPSWPAKDIVALSFVHGLPREKLYPILRGELTASDTPADGPLRGPDRPDSQPVDAAAVSGDVVADLLSALSYTESKHRANAAREAAARAVAEAHRKGMEVVPWVDGRYPPLLARIFDPPLVLWVRGRLASLCEPAVAIVGSRAASAYGEETAMRLASDLGSRGLMVVSGLARGIDAAAHRGALAAGALTVAVLGCGADVVYPPEHRDLMNDVVRHGAVVSELPPGTPPQKMHFPRRNRIISGLARAVVVVEAWQRSGALITADCALEQGREVMAVPGNVLSERHRGSHTLLKAGAALVETASDVLATLKMAGGSPRDVTVEVANDPVVAVMDPGETYSLDAVAARSGADAATLLPRLLRLELQGLVRRLPGGRFVRVRGNVLT